MKIYKSTNVVEEARRRISWLFDEFKNIRVNTSGGKDSTVVLHLCLEEARRRGRLPLTAQFIDQEAEWQATIDIITATMHHPDIDPKWYQVPFKLFNATSSTDHWLMCWDPAEEHRWMRPRDPVAITENTYGTDRFAKMFDAIARHDYPDEPALWIAGVRAEESPSRYFGLTTYPVWKGETWGRITDKKRQHITMYPIYDWAYSDVWKYIFEHQLPYNRIYDAQYAYGVPVQRMRVSNVHHETAVTSLWYLQEVEPDTYQRLTQRIAGIDMAAKLGVDDYFIRDLPFMFSTWREYRDFLLDRLITNPEWREGMRAKMLKQEEKYLPERDPALFKMHVSSILTNDWEGVKLKNYDDNFAQSSLRIEKGLSKRIGMAAVE